MFFTNYKMIYSILISPLKWKYDFVFFKKVEKNEEARHIRKIM